VYVLDLSLLPHCVEAASASGTVPSARGNAPEISLEIAGQASRGEDDDVERPSSPLTSGRCACGR
jgi:hypothetical protein